MRTGKLSKEWNDRLAVLQQHDPKMCIRDSPHIDQGWHAGFYEKFALQIKGNEQQSFHVEDEMLRTQDGDLFAFDNAKTHWVLNPSAEDRITMIVCLRRH